MSFGVFERDHPARDGLERAVRAVFLAEYGAHVPAFPDRMVASLDPAGRLLAVAGLRFAGDGLFSRIYLDGPAEQALSLALGRPVTAGQVVEFSSLAAPRAGAAWPLVAASIGFCLEQGCTVGLFTATARLRALVRRAGIPLVDLGPARRDRVANPASWGSYYLHDPRVVAVDAAGLPASLVRAPAATWHPSMVATHA